MTLHRFRRLTAPADEDVVRRAMTLALMVEVPNSVESYRRFYVRVVDELQRATDPPAAAVRARARESVSQPMISA